MRPLLLGLALLCAGCFSAVEPLPAVTPTADAGCRRPCGDQCCAEGASCDEATLTCVLCEPRCDGKQCGGDGCGGGCGECPACTACGMDYQCHSLACCPNCEGRECGDDGCGGSCGSCGPHRSCGADGWCGACAPDCTRKNCGDDGCGGSCGACGAGQFCASWGTCVFGSADVGPKTDRGWCVPNCYADAGWRECGDDGCGGVCGSCWYGQVCTAWGRCAWGGSDVGPQTDRGWCVPNCSADGGWKQCGSDGCGSQCGWCDWGLTCSTSGTCVPWSPGDVGPQTDRGWCTPNCWGDAGWKQCGSDGCGGQCGWCDWGLTCSASGTCVPWNPGDVGPQTDRGWCVPTCWRDGGYFCGPDGCNGWCTCPWGEFCSASGACLAAGWWDAGPWSRDAGSRADAR